MGQNDLKDVWPQRRRKKVVDNLALVLYWLSEPLVLFPFRTIPSC